MTFDALLFLSLCIAKSLPSALQQPAFPRGSLGAALPWQLSCHCLWGRDPTDVPCPPLVWDFVHAGPAGGSPVPGRADQPVSPAPAAVGCNESWAHHHPFWFNFSSKVTLTVTVSVCHQPRTLSILSAKLCLWNPAIYVLLQSKVPCTQILSASTCDKCVWGNICFKCSIIYLLKKWRNEQRASHLQPT